MTQNIVKKHIMHWQLTPREQPSYVLMRKWSMFAGTVADFS